MTASLALCLFACKDQAEVRDLDSDEPRVQAQTEAKRPFAIIGIEPLTSVPPQVAGNENITQAWQINLDSLPATEGSFNLEFMSEPGGRSGVSGVEFYAPGSIIIGHAFEDDQVSETWSLYAIQENGNRSDRSQIQAEAFAKHTQSAQVGYKSFEHHFPFEQEEGGEKILIRESVSKTNPDDVYRTWIKLRKKVIH